MDIQTILAIAEKHNNPDAEIQYRSLMSPRVGAWVGENIDYQVMLKGASLGYEYRIKPKTVTLNGEELPKPLPIDIIEVTRVKSTISGKSSITGLERYEFASREDAIKWESALKKLLNS